MSLVAVLEAAAECDPTRDGNEDDDADLEDAEGVLQVDTGLDTDGVDEESEEDDRDGDTALVPLGDLRVRGGEEHDSGVDGVSGGPAEEEDVGCVHGGDEEAGLLEHCLEVVLLTTVLGDGCAELHVHVQPGEGDDAADGPHDEGEADGAAQGVDGGGDGEDTSTKHSVADEADAGEEAELLLSLVELGHELLAGLEVGAGAVVVVVAAVAAATACAVDRRG